MLVLARGHSVWKKKDEVSRCGGKKQEMEDQRTLGLIC